MMERRHYSSSPNRDGLRLGVTLIEVLVIVGVLGLLFAILIPAVQSARESGRRSQCASNLHQLSLAMISFESSRGYYPYSNLGPFVEESDPSWLHKLHGELGLPPVTLENWQTIDYRMLICPSDGLDERRGNFHRSNGLLEIYDDVRGILPDGIVSDLISGTRHRHALLSAKDVTDGLSNTSMCGERLVEPSIVGDLSGSPELWHRVFHTTRGRRDTLREFADECQFHPQNPVRVSYDWVGYNHIVPPNHLGCINGFLPIKFHAIPLNSHHPSGVNLGLCDGSIRFVNESIDRDVWWALGTRNGAETITQW